MRSVNLRDESQVILLYEFCPYILYNNFKLHFSFFGGCVMFDCQSFLSLAKLPKTKKST